MKDRFLDRLLLSTELNNVWQTRLKVSYIILVLLLFSTLSLAQNNKYLVHFSDKDNSVFSIDNPEAFLSERAIERRNNQNIPIVETDLPVNANYVVQVSEVSEEVQIYQTTKWFNGVLVSMPESLIEQVKALSMVDSVELVEPDKSSFAFPTWEPKVTRNKRNKKTKEVLNDTQNTMVGISQFQEQGFSGKDILIAITDGGFQNTNVISFFRNVYDENRILMEYNFVKNSDDVYIDSSHGTEVFSQIGAFSQDEYVGAAYNAEFMLFVTEDVRADYEYRIEEYNWAFAAEKADSAGVDIINVSLGYSDFYEDPSMNYTYEDTDGKSAVISIAAQEATTKGIVVVAAAGNEGNIPWRYITMPADAENVIAVGAVNSSGVRSSTSSIGPTVDGRLKPEVMALGSSVRVINGNGRVSTQSGTSYSAPLITGLAALIWEANPDFTALDVREAILKSGSNAETPDNLIGYGIPTFDIVSSIEDEVITAEQKFSIFPNPTSKNQFYIRYSGEENVSTNISILNQLGQELHKNEYLFDPFSNTVDIDVDFLPPSEYLVVISYGNGEGNEIKKLVVL